MIYLDNAATTKMSRRVCRAVHKAEKVFGNPSTLYKIGRKATNLIVDARISLAHSLGCAPSEIYFTSGGTEADNWAINSACQYGKEKNRHLIITSCIEHPAILNTLKEKEKEGFEVIYLPVNTFGCVNVSEVKKLIKERKRDICLVTIMMVNNEIGTIEPVNEIADVCSKHKILFHTDAVQAVGHLDIELNTTNIDMLSASSHKFHGPKGAGFLYCRQSSPLYPFIFGGSQQRNVRAGTENVPGIVGTAVALEQAKENDYWRKKIARLHKQLVAGLSKIPDSLYVGGVENDRLQDVTNSAYECYRLDSNINFCFKDIDNSTLQLFLDNAGVAVSAGSACTSGSTEPSHVLKAIGIPDDYIKGNIRISLSHYNTRHQIKQFIRKIKKIIKLLRNP